MSNRFRQPKLPPGLQRWAGPLLSLFGASVALGCVAVLLFAPGGSSGRTIILMVSTVVYLVVAAVGASLWVRYRR